MLEQSDDTRSVSTSLISSGHLDVLDGAHKIYYEEHGNPKGIAIVFLHGGPGVGTSIEDLRFFDLDFWRVILLDQRGCGKSIPFGKLEVNNSAALVEDIEKLRRYLKIPQWLVFGCSWGSCLGLLYGQTYPQSCLGFILRGIFLGKAEEINNIFYGINDIFPDEYESFISNFEPEERLNLVDTIYTKVMEQDPKISLRYSEAIINLTRKCAYLEPADSKKAIAVEKTRDEEMTFYGRIFLHYCVHRFFLKDNQILNNVHKILHLPCTIVQGRYDVITLPKEAYKLHKCWPNSKIIFAEGGGHSSFDSSLTRCLINATEEFKGILENDRNSNITM